MKRPLQTVYIFKIIQIRHSTSQIKQSISQTKRGKNPKSPLNNSKSLPSRLKKHPKNPNNQRHHSPHNIIQKKIKNLSIPRPLKQKRRQIALRNNSHPIQKQQNGQRRKSLPLLTVNRNPVNLNKNQ